MWFDIAVWKVVLGIMAYFVIGWLWYSKWLFAGRWLAAVGRKRGELPSAVTGMLLSLLAQIVLVIMLAYFASATAVPSVERGIYLGFKLWLVVAAGSLANRAFQGRGRDLYVIDMGYHLAGLVVAGIILAA